MTTTTSNFGTITMPAPFPGTPEEAKANYETHAFLWDDEGDTRCMGCDSRPSHVAASYPCGADVPRITLEMR